MTFAALHCRAGNGDGLLRVLEGPVQTPHIYSQGRFGNGALASGHEGLPHMARADFTGEFPFARVRLEDGDLAVGIQLEAWSPFVPGDDEGCRRIRTPPLPATTGGFASVAVCSGISP